MAFSSAVHTKTFVFLLLMGLVCDRMKVRKYIVLPLLLAFFFGSAHAQPGFSVDIKKDKPFQSRKLKAEKTGEGKIKTPKRLFNNLTTHYNYYFNANNKLNEIFERAKAQQKDDYSQLLSFYNYSLDATAADSTQLDSVIYKCRTGIVNHDLRMEWGDELYLLWAESWHLQKKFDSASLMLQFINYAYAPQEDYGYYAYIGTHRDGAQELSIATKEEKKFLHNNLFSRNTAFIWQIRSRIEAADMTSAGSLITTLKRDPNFPKRLYNDLDEVEAYWWYKQQRWDSAAAHLIKALDGADDKREKARWEYLIAQLLERSGRNADAMKFYEEAISDTPDPLLEVYGRLNLVRINKEGGDAAIDKNIAELLKMAKKDKYEDYRDIIYNMAAQMEIQRGNTAAALDLLMKGAKYNNGNGASRSRAFLQLADVSFDQKKYLPAAAFYDSLQVADLAEADSRRVFGRKPPLKIISDNSYVITRQDSLQRIAALPQAERDDFIKKLVKQLRKQQGLKEEAAPTAGNQFASSQPADLFNGSGKGEWYFYNASSKTQGANEFKQVWGNRPNMDNWRRFAVVNGQLLANNPTNNRNQISVSQQQDVADATTELSLEGLSAKLPTTPAAMTRSNDSIKKALLNLGAAFLNDLEDYPSAINAFEEYRRRFPDAEKMDEVLFNLDYAYTKAGNAQQAAAVKKLLTEKYTSSRYAAIATTGKDPQVQAQEALSAQSTKAYEGVYNLFIEGKFDEAVTAKRLADSTYKTTFWQPQLLYIEAVYHIKQREDSLGKGALQTIIRQNTNKALTDRAQNLLSVLSRRQQIEDELNRYQIKTEDSAAVPPVEAVVKNPTVKKDTVATTPTVIKKPVNTVAKNPVVIKPADTVSKKPVVTKPATDTVAKKPIATKPPKDTVAKKPPVTKPARDTVATKPAVTKAPKDSVTKKPVTRPATDTLVKKAPTKKPADTIAKAPVVKKPATDTVAKKKEPPKPASIYSFAPETPHYAVMILDKVDPVFVNEARNAFFRYTRERYYGQPLDAQILPLTADTKLLLITGFANAQAATDYAQRAKAIAQTEIVPWLTGNKYTFSIISAANLEILKGTTNLAEYKKFLEAYLPGKF